MFAPSQEVEHLVAAGVVAELRPVGRRESADHREQRGRSLAPLRLGQRFVPGYHRTERLRSPAVRDEASRGTDDLERIRLALVRGGTPCRDPVAAEYAADRLRMGSLDRGDVEAELETGSAPWHPH